MIHWRKLRTVAMFEFLSTVKRFGYLFATFGMPLFMAVYGVAIAIPAYFAGKQDREAAIVGVVDRAGVLALQGDTSTAPPEIPEDLRRMLEATGDRAAIAAQLIDRGTTFRPFEDEAAARAAVVEGRSRAYFVIPENYLETGVVESYSADSFSFSASDARASLGLLLRERLVTGRVDDQIAVRIVRPLQDTRRFLVTPAGEIKDGSQTAAALRLAVPLVFTVLFLMSILMTSGYLLQGTAVEKENKVVEVLLASANPDEILAGKLLGLGAAGLLQIAVWTVMVFGLGVGAIPLIFAAEIEVPWLAVAVAVPLFILAFLFFGSLMLGTGSLGSNMREAQQFAMVWSLTAALPLMMMSILIRETHGTVARVLTWIPFTSGSVIVMRAAKDPSAIAWWEIVGPILVLMASTWIALRVGARLFRVGLLSTGARPSLREIMRQARLSA